MENVQTWKARVVNGRLVMDEPTDMPEGTELELAVVEEVVDDLTPEQADELVRSWESGGGIPASELLARLRR